MLGRNVSVNLGKVDAILTENEQVKGEVFQPDRAYQAVRSRSKEYNQGTEDSGIPNPSGTGKTSV